MGKGKTQQGASEQLKTLTTLCHCLVSPHCSAVCCPEFHKASAKRSVHNKEKQALYHPSSLDIQRALREIFVECSKRYFLVFLQFTDECCVNTFALQQRTRKPLNGRCNTPSLPLERSFSELMTLFDIDLLCMR